jgi:PIN domain nuclease of toxin-antitoxin system
VSKIFVLDACALVALLKNEIGADNVAAAYKKAESGDAKIIMNRVNLLEVYYGYYRDSGKEYAEKIMTGVAKSIVSISEFDKGLFNEAGRLKASYRISLADSIALAQTIAVDGELLTADHHEFDVIEGKEPIQFGWIR